MKIFKKVILAIFGVLVFAGSSFVFAGCGKDKDIAKVYVFATDGGSVQVNNNKNYVRFGDEASKVFTFKEDTKITLKAIPDVGYSFVKWEYTDELDEKLEYFSTKAEISLIVDDEVVIRAVFEREHDTHNIIYSTTSYAYEIVPVSGYTTTVVSGGTFKFRVNLKPGYTDCDVIVKNNGEEITNIVDGVYTIENITSDVNITISGISINSYSMTFESGVGYTLSAVTGYDVVNVEHGSEFKFKITLAEGYVGAVVKIKGLNDTEYTQISGINDIYTLTNVQTSYSIIAVADVATFDVVLPTDVEGLTFAFVDAVGNETKVNHNEDVSFTVVSAENVDISNLAIIGKAAAKDYQPTVTISGNVYTYTFKNVKHNITNIDVNGQKIKTFDITLPIYEGIEFAFVEGDTTVEYGSNVTFSLSIKDASINIDTIQIECNDGEISVVKADGKQEYTVENVTSNLVFKVVSSSVEYYTCNITVSGEGFTLDNDIKVVNKGSNFEFKVNIAENYEAKDGITVLVNGQTGVAVYDSTTKKYLISNIQADIEILVTGITEIVEQVVYTFNITSDYNDTHEFPTVFRINKEDLETISAADNAMFVAIENDYDDTITNLYELVESISAAIDLGVPIGSLVLDGEDFIVVTSSKITINVDLLKDNQAAYELQVQL